LLKSLDTVRADFSVRVQFGDVLNHGRRVLNNHVALKASQVVVNLRKVFGKFAQFHKPLAAFQDEVITQRSDDDTAILGVHGSMDCFYDWNLFIISAHTGQWYLVCVERSFLVLL
jgi:hypothetical protein